MAKRNSPKNSPDLSAQPGHHSVLTPDQPGGTPVTASVKTALEKEIVTAKMPRIISPSPLKNLMGSHLTETCCSFRVWTLFASSVSVKIWDKQTNAVSIIPLAKDSAEGFGNNCWSVCIPGIPEDTDYRYVITYNGKEYERIDPYGQCIRYPNWTNENQDDSDARSVVVNLSFSWSRFTPPPVNEMVIYQLHIGSFYDNNPYGMARLDQIINKLYYLKELGVNVIEFLPFSEFAGIYSMGYNTMQPYAVEHDYGTPHDLKTIINKCHELGMAVIFDVVYNHLSLGNGVPKDYSLADFDGWDSPSNPDGIFFYGDPMNRTPWGPRPDYGRPEVVKWITDNAVMWVTEYNCDGLRFDSTKCIRLSQGNTSGFCSGSDLGSGGRNPGWELMQHINDQVNSNPVSKLTIAEDLGSNPWLTYGTDRGGAGFDSQWDTSLQSSVQNAITRPFDGSIDVSSVAYSIRNSIDGRSFSRVIFCESHDQALHQRIPDRISPGMGESWYARKKSMLGAGIIFTSPGIPMIFQGVEFLNWHRWSDQTPLDWTRLDRFPKYNQFYRDLFRLRKNETSTTRGLCGESVSIIQENSNTKVLVYHRWERGFGIDDVIVVANFSSQTYPDYTIGLPYKGKWKVRLNSDSNVYSDKNDFDSIYCADVLAEDGSWDNQNFHGKISVGPFSIVILSREKQI